MLDDRVTAAVGPDDRHDVETAALLEQAVFGFAPDLMIVDKRPGGVDGELLPALRRLREAQHPTRLVLGVRDILDSPARTRRSLAKPCTTCSLTEMQSWQGNFR